MPAATPSPFPSSRALKKLLSAAGLLVLVFVVLYPFPSADSVAQGVGGGSRSEGQARAPVVRVDEPLLPIQASSDLNPAKVALGRQLFHDPRLSRVNSSW